jgi:hypothetical protein
MAEMRELIAAIDQPNVGLLLHSWHRYTAHEIGADLLSLKGAEVVACDLTTRPPAFRSTSKGQYARPSVRDRGH